MDQAAIDSLQPDDQILRRLGHDVRLTDDHQWAFYAWQKVTSGTYSRLC